MNLVNKAYEARGRLMRLSYTNPRKFALVCWTFGVIDAAIILGIAAAIYGVLS